MMEAQNALMICYDALVINETNVFLCVFLFQAYLCNYQFQALVLGTASPAVAQPGIQISLKWGTWEPGSQALLVLPGTFFRKERKICSLEQASRTARHF